MGASDSSISGFWGKKIWIKWLLGLCAVGLPIGAFRSAYWGGSLIVAASIGGGGILVFAWITILILCMLQQGRLGRVLVFGVVEVFAVVVGVSLGRFLFERDIVASLNDYKKIAEDAARRLAPGNGKSHTVRDPHPDFLFAHATRGASGEPVVRLMFAHSRYVNIYYAQESDLPPREQESCLVRLADRWFWYKGCALTCLGKFGPAES